MKQNKAYFMITCKQSTEWVIKKEQKKLSLKENLQLLSHMAICSVCRLFQKQSAVINKALAINKEAEIFRLTIEEKKDLEQTVQNSIN